MAKFITQKIYLIDEDGQADLTKLVLWPNPGNHVVHSRQEEGYVESISWGGEGSTVSNKPIAVSETWASAKLVMKYTSSGPTTLHSVTQRSEAGQPTGLTQICAVSTASEISEFSYDISELVSENTLPELALQIRTPDTVSVKFNIYELYFEVVIRDPTKYFSSSNMKYLLTQLTERLSENHIGE